ncbi:PocR ligand-binding domain-containing protein [Desulfitibacter alkalitolerans]|uniref:PocR ligand-binding domain-containing protein n=1 Tax=Desulfitibacter alkalitolerans TaxID=264641 RepID=UPI0012EC9405|nr:PocR ligand-binding domain-containing protein [Desulfitibacter alkalitolerans]
MFSTKSAVEKDINDLIQTYKISTNVDCMAYSICGEYITNEGYFERNDFCKMIQEYDNEKICIQSYIYSALQAEKFRQPSVFFCPYGLVNWTVPIVISGELKFFLTSGPVLIHEVDELLIDNIFKQNPSYAEKSDEIIAKLREVKVLSTIEVKYLSDILLRLAKSFMAEKIVIQENRRKMDTINTKLSEIVNMINPSKKNSRTETRPTSFFSFEMEKDLITNVRLGDKKGSRKIINEILDFAYKHNNFEVIKLNVVSLIIASAHASIEAGADLDTVFDLEFVYMKKVLEITNFDKLRITLIECVDGLIECAFSTANIENKDIIFKVINYIRENYRSVSLKEVSSKFHLNPTYLSRLFKEETGISYIDYVNRVKIEASKSFLKDDRSIEDVANLVGFTNQSYFAKIFKQKEGITPTEWKKACVVI